MRIIRAFPRRTNYTPTGPDVYIGRPPRLFIPEADAVKISVVFTWDIPEAEKMADEWRAVAPAEIGGPAFGSPGGEFNPGEFIRDGYVITSRGCSNRCWFCSVWRREGGLRELGIRDGWKILDDNIIATSESHRQAVFAMLRRQKTRPSFIGGIEAGLVTPAIAAELAALKPVDLFCAFDTPDDLEPLRAAGEMFYSVGLRETHPLRAYVLVGYPGDTFAAARDRMGLAYSAGFLPFAMVYRGWDGKILPSWHAFQRDFARQAITKKILREFKKKG